MANIAASYEVGPDSGTLTVCTRRSGAASKAGHDLRIEVGATNVEQHDGRLTVTGELELAGRRHALTFDLLLGPDGRLTGSATVRQTDWGMKPYTALFGTLKVRDEVEVSIDASLRSS
jgi:hypothetical protein